VISTLSVYAVNRFHLSPERLGELMSALGLSTMIAEAVLVRILVPLLGEKQSTKLGLLAFALQCFVLGFAYESWHLFVCAFLSMIGNLVYPSLSSLVSGTVESHEVGEALGSLNGIKALTEGFGPLVFGTLMTLSEQSVLPGWPYLVATLCVLAAYHQANSLPDDDDDNDANEFIPELRRRQRHGTWQHGIVLSSLSPPLNDVDMETESLISEVEESDDD
jgi:MFS transporter, DHA1 family, tetracycline resistance protein